MALIKPGNVNLVCKIVYYALTQHIVNNVLMDITSHLVLIVNVWNMVYLRMVRWLIFLVLLPILLKLHLWFIYQQVQDLYFLEK
jgi:hypothetical protein